MHANEDGAESTTEISSQCHIRAAICQIIDNDFLEITVFPTFEQNFDLQEIGDQPDQKSKMIPEEN
jgi:hypothetical protein